MPENHWEPVRKLPVICKYFTNILSGSQWFLVVPSGFWEAKSRKGGIEIEQLPGSLYMHADLQLIRSGNG